MATPAKVPAVRICFGPPRDHDELRRGLGTLDELLPGVEVQRHVNAARPSWR